MENAIKHGAAKQLGSTEIRVAVRQSADDLVLEVANTGSPAAGSSPPVDGVGIGNIRARLAELYPQRHELTVVVRPEGGAVATIRIPLSAELDDPPGIAPSEEFAPLYPTPANPR